MRADALRPDRPATRLALDARHDRAASLVLSLVMLDHASAATIVVAMNVGSLLLPALLAWSMVLLRRETAWSRHAVAGRERG